MNYNEGCSASAPQGNQDFLAKIPHLSWNFLQQHWSMALAIDSLEENLVQQLDSFRTTSLTDPTEDTTTILRTQLNSILELLTLTTITNSKKLFSEQQISSSATQRSITHILDEHHNRLHESITYSALVEVCQNDTVPARRLVALSFFADLFTAMQGKVSFSFFYTSLLTN